MRINGISRPKTTLTFALLGLALVSGCGSSYGGSGGSGGSNSSSKADGSGASSPVVVKTASVPSAGGTALVNSQGLTLYHLSAEQNGKFICTGSCESVWHPLISASGTPNGVASLSTVKRPDGSEQVAYKGMPLYTFAQDTQPGQAQGQGVKDVGTWMVATVGAGSSSGAAATQTPSTSSEGSSSGGGYKY